MPRFSALVFLAVLTLMLKVNPALAQGGKGSISGRITDPSGAVLKGAKISLDPSNLNVVSDGQGEFLMTDLNPGTYSILVSYLGFAPFTKTVEVAAGASVRVDAPMILQTQNLELLVTAPRPSAEAAAVNQERSADNIVQVLPADVIRSLPNANMADALGRLPGVTLERDEGEGKYVQIRGTEPRLTNTTIDGMNIPSPETGVRQIKFDSIPADIVEAVEINKTLQANMDGDGIGGSVNLVTKTAEDRPTISLGGMGGYTPIDNGRGLTEWTGTVGKRFGTEKRWGFLLGGSYDWNGRGIDDIEPVADIATLPNGQTERSFDQIAVRQYVYYRTRWALAGSTDYKLGAGSDIYARWLYSDFKNYGDRTEYVLNNNDPGISLLNPTPGTPTFDTEDRRPNIAIGTLAIGGNHVLSSIWYKWEAAASRSRDIDVAGGQANFSSTLSSSACQYNPAATTNVYLPQWTPSCYTEARLLKEHRIRRLTADDVLTALREQPLRLAPGAAEAASEHALFQLPLLRVLKQQRTEIARRIERVLEEMSMPEKNAPGQQEEHRDVTIILALPGVGRVVAATMLAEASQALAEREYHALRSYAGTAPITRQSGKKKVVVMRQSCNPRLRNALYHWTRVSTQCDEQSKAHYAELRGKGHSHGRALRGVGDRLMAVLIAMLTHRTLYDPSRRTQAEDSARPAA
jgi:hypothetical protein